MKTNIYYLLTFVLILVHCRTIQAQSSEENYIMSRTMLTKDGSKYLDNIQYLDGLGRPVQTVQKGITPGGNDLVTFQEYDDFGRESNSWIPTPVGNNSGKLVEDFVSKAISYHKDSDPYSKPFYEASPLNRIMKEMGPGNVWHSNNKGITTEYLSNTATGVLSAIYYKMNNNTLSKSGNYKAGELYVQKTCDEDGNPTYTFTNKLGQIILNRQINRVNGKDEYYDTYYVYDEFGKVRYVLPPMIEGNITQENLDLYAYYYKYDERKRCIEKKLPGCEVIKMLYDRADRLIMSQTGNQRIKNLWTVNKYDNLGRMLYTSEVKVLEDIDQLRQSVREYSMTEEFSTGTHANPMEDTGYSRNYFNVHPTSILTVNYYDDYRFLELLPGQDKQALTYQEKSGYDTRYGNAKGLLTGTRIYDLNDPKKFTATAYYYDYQGNEIQVLSTNHMGGYEKNYYKRSFMGNVEEHMHEHTAKDKDKISEIYKYDYDHAQRLLKTSYKLNTNNWIVLSENSYNELGQMDSKGLHGKRDVTTYKYNIRNWITNITGTRFKQNLGYTVRSYNGNIDRMEWETGDEPDKTRMYFFRYDNLSRMTEARYGECSYSMQICYEVKYGHVNINAYDKHGNIKSLERSGMIRPSIVGPGVIPPFSTGGVIDDLLLEYKGNQLVKVKDQAINDPVNKDYMHFVDGADKEIEYTYDKNGNITSDSNKGISSINYNLLNLPSKIYFGPKARTDNMYDAGGNKYQVKYLEGYSVVPKPGLTDSLQVSIKDSVPSSIERPWNPVPYPGGIGGSIVQTMSSPVSSGSWTTQPPLHNYLYTLKTTIDYCDNIIYKDGKLDKILTSEGYVDKNENGNFVYHYYLKDHQGNNRVVMRQDGEIEQVNHYYPFGGLFGDSNETGSNQTRKYNDKELDRMYELNWYDYTARRYDAVLGRFTTMDPLCEMYYWISPYAYCMNNPIKYIDPTGMLASPYYDEDGNYLGVDENGFEGDIYITDQETFEQNSENGVANSAAIQANNNTNPLKDVNLSSAAESNIYTDVLNKMPDLDTSLLYKGKFTEGKVSIRDKVVQRGIRNLHAYGYNDPFPSKNQARFNTSEVDGQIRVTVQKNSNTTDLFSVESIWNYLGVHEYYGHGIIGWSGSTNTHYKCYEAQMKHPTFKKLRPEQQKDIRDNYKKYYERKTDR